LDIPKGYNTPKPRNEEQPLFIAAVNEAGHFKGLIRGKDKKEVKEKVKLLDGTQHGEIFTINRTWSIPKIIEKIEED